MKRELVDISPFVGKYWNKPKEMMMDLEIYPVKVKEYLTSDTLYIFMGIDGKYHTWYLYGKDTDKNIYQLLKKHDVNSNKVSFHSYNTLAEAKANASSDWKRYIAYRHTHTESIESIELKIDKFLNEN